MKYCVTAANRLTGKRERISGALSDQTAIRKKRELMARRARTRPYLRAKVERWYPHEKWIPFTDCDLVFYDCQRIR